VVSLHLSDSRDPSIDHGSFEIVETTNAKRAGISRPVPEIIEAPTMNHIRIEELSGNILSLGWASDADDGDDGDDGSAL
jgi:hypothetical protein